MFDFSFQQLWLNAIAVLPIALIVAAVCRWVPCRPTTRHALWIVVLAMFFVPSLIGGIDLPGLATDDRSSAPLSSKPPPIDVFPNDDSEHSTTLGATDSDRRESSVRVALLEEKVPPTTADSLRVEVAPDRSGPIDFDRFVQRDSTADTVEIIPPDTRTSSAVLPETDIIEEQDHMAIAESNEVSTESQWTASLLNVRDAFAGIPPLPATIWLGGMGIVAYLVLFRIGRVSRLVRTAERAPIDVVQTVHRAAEELGLERGPRTVMVDARISPMLWCASQPTLILPKLLWAQLDEHGRRAVVFHELAHLKRRDHWVRWIEMVISVVYWWNPLVWWLRKRIRDEADYCCDAWVTHLMPQSRRAYAQALLESRKYLSATALVGPAVGLGAGGTRTRTFARRLTMVMTHQLGPRLSVRGLTLAATIAATACLVTPITACPPEKHTQKIAAATSQPARLIVAVEKPNPLSASKANANETTFEKHSRAGRAYFPGTGDGNDDLEARMARLEQRLDRLAGTLERLFPANRPQRPPARVEVTRTPRGASEHQHGDSGHAPHADGPHSRGEQGHAPHGDRPHTHSEASHSPHADGPGHHGGEGHGDQVRGSAPGAMTGSGRGRGPTSAPSRMNPRGPSEVRSGPAAGPATRHAQPPAPRRPSPPRAGGNVSTDRAGEHSRMRVRGAEVSRTDVRFPSDATIVRRYYLPGGKLEALNTLMVRPDVPILVGPEDDYIEVKGTAEEHRIFRAFCDMIHPEGVTVKQDGTR